MNDEEDFFDGATVALHERGASFGMAPTCYLRMARCALRAMEYGGVEPVLIRRLRTGPGCELSLFGTANAYTLRVSAEKARRVSSSTSCPWTRTCRRPVANSRAVTMNPGLGTTSRLR
jgi:hypothetical protein